MVVLHWVNSGRVYVAPILSLASFFRFIVLIANIVFAFLIAYGTRNLWVKEAIYYEVPDVEFNHVVLGTANGARPTETFAFGTLKTYTDIFNGQVRAPTIRASTQQDVNNVILMHSISIQIPLFDNETVSGIQGVLIFSYMLQSLVRLQIEAAVFFDYAWSAPGFLATIDGTMQLNYQTPLPVTSSALQSSNTDLIPTDSILSLPMVDLGTLQSQYNARNITTSLETVLKSWQVGSLDTFTLNINVRVPEQQVRYQPTVMEVVKFAWIQFITISLVLWWLSNRALDIIFEQQVFRTRMIDLNENGAKYI